MHGGAWLTVGGMPVDVIFRDLDVVEQRVARAERGAPGRRTPWPAPACSPPRCCAPATLGAPGTTAAELEAAVAAVSAALGVEPPAAR
jgi:hypothetical protein